MMIRNIKKLFDKSSYYWMHEIMVNTFLKGLEGSTVKVPFTQAHTHSHTSGCSYCAYVRKGNVYVQWEKSQTILVQRVM